MQKVHSIFNAANGDNAKIVPGFGNVPVKHSSKKAVFKTIASVLILQGVAYYCFYVYSLYNEVVHIIENPPVITEIQVIEKEVEKAIETETTSAVPQDTGGKESHQDTIRRVAAESSFSDPELLIAIAECESGDRNVHVIRPDVPNTQSTALGAFQYLEGTWEEGVKLTGNDWTLDDRKDLEKSTRMAIWHIHKGYLSKWNESRHCWGNQI